MPQGQADNSYNASYTGFSPKVGAIYALHPGVVASDVWRAVPWPFRSLIKLRMISTEEGARTSLYCATAPECAAQTGLYYDKCRVRAPSTLGQDLALAQELWRRSEAWLA